MEFYKLRHFLVDGCKGIINWGNLDIVSDVSPVIPDETAATYRTYIFTLVYISLHGALIFTALFSLCGINNSCLGKRSFPIFFAPWIFVCCSILVMDILATTYYVMDTISALVRNQLIFFCTPSINIQRRAKTERRWIGAVS